MVIRHTPVKHILYQNRYTAPIHGGNGTRAAYAAANPTNTRNNAHNIILETTHGTESYVLVNSENIVKPQQLMTSNVKNIYRYVSSPGCIQ